MCLRTWPGSTWMRSEPPALHLLIRLAPALVGDFGVAADRPQPAATECFGDAPSVAHRLLEQGPQGVSQLVGENTGMPSRRASWRQTCRAPARVSRLELAALLADWKTMNRAGGVVGSGGEALLDRGPRLVGDLDRRARDHPCPTPTGGRVCSRCGRAQDLRNLGPSGQQLPDQRSVALLGQRVAGECSRS